MAPPECPSPSGGLEDPLFGPAVSFGISGALTDLVGDRAFRIPPISALDAAEMVRAIKAAPLLFGYRGSEQVDVPAVEDLVRRVAQLKIDLPQVSRIDLVLVHATAQGVSVLHAAGRIDAMSEPRSDLFVRRLTDPLDDTLAAKSTAPGPLPPRGSQRGLDRRRRVTDWRHGPCCYQRPLPGGDLVVAIEKTGYYPQVVSAGVRSAVAGENVSSFLVHHEPTIDRDEVRRHITVVVLTSTRLILCHTDEHAPDDLLPEPYTSTSTEAIMLSSVRSIVVNRMIANPATFEGGGAPTPSEAVLTVGWGGINRIDLEPAACSDPECDADHGYTGMVVSDDFSLRVSSAADGQGAVDDLLVFAESLSARQQS